MSPADKSRPFHIFISRVTGEFGKVSAELAADLRAKGMIGKLQVDFRHEPDTEIHAEVEKSGGNGEFSSEADGTTFKKLFCMAFDLAVLSEYAGSRFYHFIYHDGALEGEDDRKKLALLKLVERLCEESGIQYIMSAIRHELPRNPDDTPFTFNPGEVVRELHDNGDDGRLFRMAVF